MPGPGPAPERPAAREPRLRRGAAARPVFADPGVGGHGAASAGAVALWAGTIRLGPGPIPSRCAAFKLGHPAPGPAPAGFACGPRCANLTQRRAPRHPRSGRSGVRR